MLSLVLRCRPASGPPAEAGWPAPGSWISGACQNASLRAGVFVWRCGAPLRSMGDVFADTVVVYDPDGTLALRWSAAGLGPTRSSWPGGGSR